jgi:3-oxoacyl-[acyl-carrier protein] reductase
MPTCVITGASRGIGLATALRFARDGWSIVAAARNVAELSSAAAQILATGAECEAVTADVSLPTEIQKLLSAATGRFGRIDALVNNAGVAPLAPIEELDPAAFDQALAVNVAAVFHATRAVWPVMRHQGGGVIINVSSLASVDPFPGFAVYGACKAWVNLFSQALAVEGKPHHIRVFSVAPGAVETRMLRSRFPDLPADQVLAPAAVADVIYSLADPKSAPKSGQTIFVRK